MKSLQGTEVLKVSGVISTVESLVDSDPAVTIKEVWDCDWYIPNYWAITALTLNTYTVSLHVFLLYWYPENNPGW
jgi:hypothetical protein